MELKRVTVIGLRALIEYAHTETIVISDGNLQDVFEAANHLQFVEILTFCSRYLRNEMTVVYGLLGCKRETKSFILDNFISVACSDDFCSVPCDLFCKFLSYAHRLCSQSELDVFRIALSFLETLVSLMRKFSR